MGKTKSYVKMVMISFMLFYCILSANMFGQSVNATLEGLITDNNNEPLPGATVTLKNVDSGYKYSVISKLNGSYIISGIAPGKYDIEVNLSGFKSSTKKAIAFAVGAKLRMDFVLVPETISEEVTVTAETPVIEVSKSEVSSVVGREIIDNLPLLSRNFNDLTILSAGVIDGKSNAQPEGSEEMVVDGVSNKDVTSNSPGVILPADAIEEFRVITNLAPAEYGNASGMITTAISRSGTNTYQGRLSYFYRDESLDSVNYFINHAKYQGEELPKDQWQKAPYSRNNFGGFLGGPIIKDKLHFFVLYDGTTADNYSVVTCPLVENETVKQPSYVHQFLAKLNYQMNEKNQLSARVNYYFSKAENQGVGGFYTTERATNVKATDLSAVVSWTSFFSSKTMNELRLLYKAGRSYNDPLYPDLFTIERPSGYFGKDQNLPQDTYSDKFEIVENFSLFHRNHSIKIGADFTYAPTGTKRMDLYYPGLFVFATDAPFDPNDFSTYPILFQYNRRGSISMDMPYYMLAIFAQDSWRCSNRLTINYGLRWNYYNLEGLKEKPGDIRNFNPRLGFSFDPKGDGKSSIRGGIGTYSVNLNSNSAGPIVFWDDFDLYIKVYPNYPDPFSPNPFFPPDINFPAQKGEYASSTLIPPWSLQAMVGYARQIGKDVSVSADIIYTRGHNHLRSENLNPILPGTYNPETGGQRPDPTKGDIHVVSCEGKSEYKGLYLTFNKKYSNGWSLDVSYTLSKSMGDTDTMGGGDETITNPWSYDSDAWERAYGRTSFDARHKLTIASTVNLPFGIQLSGLFFYRSAFPWNAITGDDGNQDSLVGEYVDEHRNSRSGFDCLYLNLRLSKTFSFSNYRLQLIAESFNVTNRVNFTTVYNIYGTSDFGKPIAAGDPRLIQFGVRFNWN